VFPINDLKKDKIDFNDILQAKGKEHIIREINISSKVIDKVREFKRPDISIKTQDKALENVSSSVHKSR
jgi:hypothetical protein